MIGAHYTAPTITIDNNPLHVTDTFTYLGSTISQNALIDDEISAQIGKANFFLKKLNKGKIVEKFGATDYMVRRVKEFIREKGILATPNPKMSARTLSDQTVELVKEWYRSDEISCVMPGMKDVISVKIEDRRMQVQKRIILCNLQDEA